MITLLISGSDTDIGKTFVTAALARRRENVQIVKPYQTGVSDISIHSDADTAAPPNARAVTLRRFKAPLGPICAALAENKDTELKKVLAELAELPACRLRLIEGSGGLSVLLKRDGYDWADFANDSRADGVCLVVPDRLGAIHQARTTWFYAQSKGLNAGVILNEPTPYPPSARASNRARLADCGIPIWGTLGFQQSNITLSPYLAKLLSHA